MVLWGIKLLCNTWKSEKQGLSKNLNTAYSRKEIQIQDLWNRKSKSNINRSDGG